MSFTAAHNEITPVAEIVDRLGSHPPVVLAVWAHPDDESFLAGGLLSEVCARGGRLVNVSATAGELGTDDPVANPPTALGARRRGELIAALGELGTSEGVQLDFADGACDQISDRMGAAAIGAIIDQVEPDVVVTFGPDGVTGHPDHQAVGRWTRRAVADRGDLIPVLFTAAAAVWSDWCVERLHEIGAFWPGFPEQAGLSEQPAVALALAPGQLARKLAALDRHASQMGPVRKALGHDGFVALAASEAYQPANAAAVACLAPGGPASRTRRLRAAA